MIDPAGSAPAPSTSFLVMHPSSSLIFPPPLTRQITNILSISNPTSGSVAYKVKTTTPKRYCVKPRFGVLGPNESIDIQISLHPMRENVSIKTLVDKFLVESAKITPEEQGINVQELWKTMPKQRIGKQKLRCKFEAKVPDNMKLVLLSDGSAVLHSVDATPSLSPRRLQNMGTEEEDESEVQSYERPRLVEDVEDEDQQPQQPHQPQPVLVEVQQQQQQHEEKQPEPVPRAQQPETHPVKQVQFAEDLQRPKRTEHKEEVAPLPQSQPQLQQKPQEEKQQPQQPQPQPAENLQEVVRKTREELIQRTQSRPDKNEAIAQIDQNELRALRDKYNQAVQQLSASQIALKKLEGNLEQTQKERDALKQRVAELQAAVQEGLRRRNTTSATEPTTTTTTAVTGAVAGSTVAAGGPDAEAKYSLFTLLLVAVFAFLIGVFLK